VERGDRYAPSTCELSQGSLDRLLSNASIDAGRARALALTAIRETYEETGFLIGKTYEAGFADNRLNESWRAFLSHGVVPALSGVRFLSRAVTPTSQPRRFDTRFFVVNADMICKQVDVPDQELDTPEWVTIAEARATERLPWITGVVLKDLEAWFEIDQTDDEAPVTFRRKRGNSFQLHYL